MGNIKFEFVAILVSPFDKNFTHFIIKKIRAKIVLLSADFVLLQQKRTNYGKF